MMIIDNRFNIRDIVFIKTDVEQLPRFVCGFIVYESSIIYRLACGINFSEHYDFELSLEKNYAMNIAND